MIQNHEQTEVNKICYSTKNTDRTDFREVCVGLLTGNFSKAHVTRDISGPTTLTISLQRAI